MAEYESYADEDPEELPVEVDSSQIEPVEEEDDPPPTSPGPSSLNANPFFETELAPWIVEGGSLTRTQAEAHEHDYSAVLSSDGATETVRVRSESGIKVTADTEYVLRGWFLQPEAAAEIEYGIDWFNAGGTLLSTSSSRLTPGQGGWSRSNRSYRAPVDAATAQLRVTLGSGPAANAVTYMDELLFALAPEPDTIPPAIGSTTPQEAAIDVPLASPVSVTFSEPVSEVRITLKDAANAEVQGVSAANSRRTTYTFTPAAALSAETVYTAEVSGVVDDAGNALPAPFTWSFTSGHETQVPRTISLPAQANGWIDSMGGKDFTDDTLYTGAYGDFSLMIYERTYLTFDASALNGKEITSAQLEMWNTEVYGCGDAGSGLQTHRITGAWNPSALTWSNQPAATDAVVSREPGVCNEDPESGVLWTWPVTQAVQAWASSGTAYGLMVRGVDESATSLPYDRGFVSTRTVDGAERAPVLTVTYLDTEGSDPTPTPDPEPDSTPPTVVEVNPSNGATGVPVDQQVSVTFSEPVADAEFTLTDILEERPVAGTVRINAARTVLTFTPEEPLDWWYEAEVSGARDATGNLMAPYSWSFEGDWSAPNKRASDKSAEAGLLPSVGVAWARPFTTANGATVTSSATPQLHARIVGAVPQRSSVEVEVRHAPDRTAQGSGLIWLAKTDVTTGTTARFRVPEGKLADGWKVVWRMRVTANDRAGAWSEWKDLTVREPGTAPASVTTAKADDDELEFPYNHVNFQECADNVRLSGALRRKHGWIKNMYSWCSMRVLGSALEKKVYRNGVYKKEIVGQVEFLFSVAGKTLSGGAKVIDKKPGPYAEIDKDSGVDSRTIYAWARIDYPRITQDLIALGGKPYFTENNVTITANVQGTGSPSAGACKANNPAGKRATIANWRAVPQVTMSFFSDKAASSSPHNLGICTLSPQLRLETPGKTGNMPTNMAKEPVRCDTSEDLAKRYGGCVFRKKSSYVVHRIWGYEGGAAVQNESTALIDDAFERPDSTWPTKHDGRKVIPGEYSSGTEIHRTASKEINLSNREDSGSWCYARWPGVNPEKQELDCDEYPFATTLEGSSSISGKARNFAVRYVDRAHNRSVGGALPSFFNQNRILGSSVDGKNVPNRYNAFTVKVVN
ncbi:Ig-like domain-containing protein [Nonomuraea sp. NPDC048882]|uniref:Ig-like domain-containing protein n=1 Tax=Nonomuraea sp. NPDC048882 TaxID=3154347 RepID=UPI00340A7589